MSSLSTELRRRFGDFDRLPPGTLDGDVLGALRGRHLLVAGASGFVGSWLLAALWWLNEHAAASIKVSGTSRRPMQFAERWFRNVIADFRRPYDVPDADFVVHAAMSSEAAPAGGDAAIGETARAGSAWAIAAATRGARMLVLSSGAVVDSTDAYAEAKREVERDVLAAAQSGHEIAIARLYTCMGPGYRSHAHLAHVSLFDDAWRGGPLRLRGDGSAVRSYLYGPDMAAWLLRGLVLAERGETFAVGSPDPVRVLDLARMVAAAAGLPASAVTTGPAASGVTRTRYVPMLGEAHRRMSLAVWTPLDAAVARTLELREGPES